MNGPEGKKTDNEAPTEATANIDPGGVMGRDTHYHFPVTIEVIGVVPEEQIGHRVQRDSTTHYHLPVTVEVVGGAPEEQVRDIEDRLWARLAQSLNHTA